MHKDMALKLKTFYTEVTEFNGILMMSNLDDVFRKLNKWGIEEVEVDREEMLVIAMWSLANASHSPENMTIIREGKLDKFLGIKLIYEPVITH